MKKLIFIKPFIGNSHEKTYKVGDVAEFNTFRADQLIEMGVAEFADSQGRRAVPPHEPQKPTAAKVVKPVAKEEKKTIKTKEEKAVKRTRTKRKS